MPTVIIACSSTGTEGDGNGSRTGSSGEAAKSPEQLAAEKVDTDHGTRVARGIMGLPESPSMATSESGRARMARYEAVAARVIAVIEEREPGAMLRFGQDLAARTSPRSPKAFTTMRNTILMIATSDEVKTLVKGDPAFAGVQMRSLGLGGGVRMQADPVGGIPDLGRGPDGNFGDGRTGAGQAVADLADMAVDPFTPWRTLGRIDRGELIPDPESRLGAYAATRGYPPGSVGEAVHNAIGGIYIALGNYGEERIGRVFNSPEARALYNQPVESEAGALMASIEQRYWANVQAEDGWSPGGNLGAAFSPAVRDFLQREIFSTGTLPPGSDGGASELSQTDCGDKSDGWWCLDVGGGEGWMVYCVDKQISGGCGCASCGTGGTQAGCGGAPPPAACQ